MGRRGSYENEKKRAGGGGGGGATEGDILSYTLEAVREKMTNSGEGKGMVIQGLAMMAERGDLSDKEFRTIYYKERKNSDRGEGANFLGEVKIDGVAQNEKMLIEKMEGEGKGGVKGKKTVKEKKDLTAGGG